MADAEQLSTFAVIDGGDVNVAFMLFFATVLAWSNGANDIANCAHYGSPNAILRRFGRRRRRHRHRHC
jgi:hypothetical protein